MSFTQILNVSISASWLVLAIAILRLLLKKAPKALHCALWALVAVRLLCPVSIESGLSLIPSREVIPQQYLTAEPSSQTPMDTPARLEIVTNPIYDTPITLETDTTIDRLQHLDLFATVLWLGGMGAMGIYAVYSFLSLRLRVRMAGWLKGNVYECDEISSPFILGLLRPRIYLPGGLDEITRSHVLAHENAHLKRLDHLWKPLGFVLLTIHWFNPVMWLGYLLLCRDIELACDEAVIQKLDRSAVRSYSEALVRCSVSPRSIAMCPLAFGEVGVKGRIKAMLNYRKPGFWIIALALTAAVTLAVCFLTDPVAREDNQQPTLSDILHNNGFVCENVVPTELTVALPRSVQPYTLREDEPRTYSPAEYPLYSTDTTTVYLYEFYYRTDYDQYIYVLDFDYSLPPSGSLISVSKPMGDGTVSISAYLKENHPQGVHLLGINWGRQLCIHVDRTVYEQLQAPLSVTICNLFRLDYHPAEPQPDVVDTISNYAFEGDTLRGPRFQLHPDGTFQFSENPLSSYLGYGTYTLNGDQLVMKTGDGRYTWTFQWKDGVYCFDGEHSSIVQWYPDLKNLQRLPDGARFVQLDIPDSEVEVLLEIICSSPAQSSNPGAYIEAHPAEYARLVELDAATVSWCFQQFAKGGQTDLRGHIMALACKDIIGKTESLSVDSYYMTGQDWFDDFTRHAQALREDLGIQEFSKFHPWYAMALEILGI